MTAITARRKTASTGSGDAAEIEALRAEVAELRAQLLAVAAFATRIGYNRAPAGVQLRNLGDLCRFYDCSGHRDALERIFAAGG